MYRSQRIRLTGVIAGVTLAASLCGATGQEYYPRDAGSWGGKVRSGPGTKYRQTGSLREGEAITLVRNTGQFMNGYPWFEIRFRNARRGYKWGGLLCGFGEPISGLHRTCKTNVVGNNAENGGADFVITGASGGGIVRAGPGTNYRKLTSTTQFEPVEIIGRTGVFDQGREWLRIRFRGGRTGFQHGGLLCYDRTDLKFPSAWGSCGALRAALSGNSKSRPVKPSRSDFRNDLTYICTSGRPMRISFREQGGQAFAIFSYDNGPEIRVSSQQTGSGFLYSDSNHELRGKGSGTFYRRSGVETDFCRASD